MLESERIIQWQVHLEQVRIWPQKPLESYIDNVAKRCGVTNERVIEVLEHYGPRMVAVPTENGYYDYHK